MDWGLMLENTPLLLLGLRWTIVVSSAGMALALALAVGLVAMGRTSNRLVRGIARVHTEIILGTPNLVLLFIVFFILPEVGLVIEPFTAGLITLGLYYSPYLAEVIRGAMNAVPRGQIEAGEAIGLSGPRILTRIVGPQAIGMALPPATGLFIGLIKDSAILSVISVAEMTFQAKQVIARTYAPFEVYVLVAVGYWVLTFLLELGLRRLEGRVTRYRSL
ncbi:MAG: amino acid ABC transporter permease [Azospirillaceae bacterium]